jgi:hypothetical protein
MELSLKETVHMKICMTPSGPFFMDICSRTLLFRTLRSRDHDVAVVGRKINLGYWEFGMGREWGGVEKGEVSS